MAIDLQDRVTVAEEVLSNEVGGESVLLNLKNEHYYGLDEVGTRMWLVLTTSESFGAAMQTLLEEYEVEEDRLRSDMEILVGKLAEQGLVTIHAAAPA